MALTKKIEVMGIVFENAYARIDNVWADKKLDEEDNLYFDCRVRLSVFTDKTCKNKIIDTKVSPITLEGVKIDYNGGEVSLENLYNAIKETKEEGGEIVNVFPQLDGWEDLI